MNYESVLQYVVGQLGFCAHFFSNVDIFIEYHFYQSIKYGEYQNKTNDICSYFFDVAISKR